MDVTSPATSAARLVLLHACRDSDGEPRPGLLLPGERIPRAFPNLAAALAELRRIEGIR